MGAAEDSSEGIVNTVLTLWVSSRGLRHSDWIIEDDTSDTSGVNMRSAAKIRRGIRPGRPVRFTSGLVGGRTGSAGKGVTPDDEAKFSCASLTTSGDRKSVSDRLCNLVPRKRTFNISNPHGHPVDFVICSNLLVVHGVSNDWQR